MRFGLQISPYLLGSTKNPWDSVANLARFADESTFDSLWLYDHFLYEGDFSYHPFSEPVMECLTTLGAISTITKRIRLGSLVLGVPYRNPAMVAKMATTLDLISHGRLILGLGAGWHVREYEGYGWGEFETASVRMKRLEEAICVVLALWKEQPAHFEGMYYRLAHVLDNPKPVQNPYPPILIGGCGKKVTLRLVAQYGNFCNVWGDPDTVGGLFGILRDHCQRLNRSYDEITRSIMITVIIGRDNAEVAAKREQLSDYIPWGGETTLIGTPDTLIRELEGYREVGCQYTILRMPDWINIEPVRLFAERVIPALAGH
ncbi:MAG: LLM class flavin-dependent oxidoreductase [Ardenticatenaceae bacterium]|nr:LLM class flavin-dependent oxidoreductase [Ardenticatenaceae bacterium]